ncbi:MAG TPA: hypothetical protein VHU83_00995 [Bryobacteraceae bacterium]|nr:hypothetical protein [Bryobacteraceae bacterium]
MPASKHLRVLSVRLPESELRRFKGLAASRGLTIQEALQQALDAWSARIPGSSAGDIDDLEGSLADVDVEGLRRSERQLEIAKDRLAG